MGLSLWLRGDGEDSNLNGENGQRESMQNLQFGEVYADRERRR